METTVVTKESKFTGGLLGLIGINILQALLIMITLGFGAPWAICMKERWIAEHTYIDGQQLVFDGKQTPNFVETVSRVNYEDGCKITFTDGSWVICRFSGTEPLLRIAAEGNTRHQARNYIQLWRSLLKL